MKKTQIITELLVFEKLISDSKNILLINPLIYDFRLEWSQWHQPTGLLQLGSLLRQQGKEVRLIDCLYTHKERIPRQKIGVLELENCKFNKWHYGISFDKLKAQVRTMLDGGWQPDTILVASLNSIWWEAIRDTIKDLKKTRPNTKVILGGSYPTVTPEHAIENSGADEIFIGAFPGISHLPTDLTLYPTPPNTTGIYFYSSRTVYDSRDMLNIRTLDEVVAEVMVKAKLGVREFVFFDEEIRIADQEAFSNLLEMIGRLNLDVRFVLPGNISPMLITRDLAVKMQEARVTQIYLRCDLDFGNDSIKYTTPLSDYKRCVETLLRYGGFKPRNGKIAAMLVVGLPYENLNLASERLIQLAHTVGSAILVPFQYVPGLHNGAIFDKVLAQYDSFAPDAFNPKLFPLAHLSGRKLEEYIELIRLGTLLNSKYRDKSFDFLGDTFAARLFRESIRNEGWNPFRESSEELEIPLAAHKEVEEASSSTQWI